MSEFTPSKRSQVAPFLVMDVMEAADRAEREGRRILHLEVGQPGTAAPQLVQQAAHRAIDEDQLGYCRATGLLSLRQAIAQHYQDTYGVAVDPDAVVVTSGASGAFVLAFIAAFEANERVALTEPGYPCYPNILRALALQPVPVRVGPDSGYQLSIEQLEALDQKPAGLVVASPANPTGSMLSPESLRSLLSYCRNEGIFVVVDEIYHGLVFNGSPPTTAAEFSDSCIVINSFSKYFSMTGWRLGWMIVPESFRRTAEILSQNLAICAPTLSQHAAIAAFAAHDELQGHVARYGRNREVLLAALRGAGVTRIAPADGAFYIYADFSEWSTDTVALCEEMLREVQIAATSGVDFDPGEGSTMVRLSYCRDEETVSEAARRLRDFLIRRRRKH